MTVIITIFVVVMVIAVAASWIGLFKSGPQREHYDDSLETWTPPGDLGSPESSPHAHSTHGTGHHHDAGGSPSGGSHGGGHHGGGFGGGHH